MPGIMKRTVRRPWFIPASDRRGLNFFLRGRALPTSVQRIAFLFHAVSPLRQLATTVVSLRGSGGGEVTKEGRKAPPSSSFCLLSPPSSLGSPWHLKVFLFLPHFSSSYSPDVSRHRLLLRLELPSVPPSLWTSRRSLSSPRVQHWSSSGNNMRRPSSTSTATTRVVLFLPQTEAEEKGERGGETERALPFTSSPFLNAHALLSPPPPPSPSSAHCCARRRRKRPSTLEAAAVSSVPLAGERRSLDLVRRGERGSPLRNQLLSPHARAHIPLSPPPSSSRA